MDRIALNILFFVEPRIDMENAYIRSWWIDPFCLDLIKTLRESKGDCRFQYCISMNEPLEKKFGNIDGIEKKIFTQEELFPPFIGDSIDLSIKWYKESYSDEQMSYYKILMLERFKDFIPDIIITFTPAPYLRKAFPAALILHHESLFLSRAPYPSSYYLDPCDMYFGSTSFLHTHRDDIKCTELTEEQYQIIKKFKASCQTIIKEKSPFDEIIMPLKDKYDYLVLLPLGAARQYAFDGTTRLNIYNVYQYLTCILDSIPDNIGVIVTFAPAIHRTFNDETIDFFKAHYSHFVYHEEFEKYDAVSQYMLAYVDGVVGMSTGLCYQTLLWDVKLLELGDSEIIADAYDLNDIEKMLQENNKNKDNILYWILTRYSVQKEYLHNPEWLSKFLKSSLEKFRKDGISFDFFEPIDSDENIFKALIDGLDENIPQINGRMNYEKLKKSYEDLNTKYGEIKAENDGLCANSGFDYLSVMMKRGERLFKEEQIEEARDHFSIMLSGVNKFKGDIMNNLAVIHVQEGRLDQAEMFLKYLISEGYESEQAEQNLEMVKALRAQKVPQDG